MLFLFHCIVQMFCTLYVVLVLLFHIVFPGILIFYSLFFFLFIVLLSIFVINPNNTRQCASEVSAGDIQNSDYITETITHKMKTILDLKATLKFTY